MAETRTTLDIAEETFLIDGQPTYAGQTFDGHPIEGRLFNARMIQALFDDDNPATIDNWAYPDTGAFDPERNVAECIAAMPSWYRHGLRAITINLQCGSPEGYSDEQPWIVSAYRPDGSLKPAWLSRLRRVLDRADDLGMAVFLGLFYFGQDEVLEDETAIRTAIENVLEWLAARNYQHLVIEVNNECDINYDHDILKPPGVCDLIDQVSSFEQDGWTVPVGTSFSGNAIPTNGVIDASDVIFLHGNGVDAPARIREMVETVRESKAYRSQPIVFNEDDHFCFGSTESNVRAAIEAGASWGYFDPGENDYHHGYQSPPVRWDINTARKRAFFGYLSGVTDAIY